MVKKKWGKKPGILKTFYDTLVFDIYNLPLLIGDGKFLPQISEDKAFTFSYVEWP